MLEKKSCLMLDTIECKLCHCRPTVSHRPQYCDMAHLVKPITGINDHRTDRLHFLSQQPCGFQYHQPPPNPPPSVSASSLSASYASPSSISSLTISILSIAFLISSLAPTSTSPGFCRSSGFRGTFPIPPTAPAPPMLYVPPADTVFSFSDASSAPPSGSCACLSRRCCATAWVDPSMSASLPSHSWRLPQAAFPDPLLPS